MSKEAKVNDKYPNHRNQPILPVWMPRITIKKKDALSIISAQLLGNVKCRQIKDEQSQEIIDGVGIDFIMS